MRPARLATIGNVRLFVGALGIAHGLDAECEGSGNQTLKKKQRRKGKPSGNEVAPVGAEAMPAGLGLRAKGGREA